jgi:RHS repeat-associated protein
VPNRVFTATLCGVPAVAVTEEGGPVRLVSTKLAGPTRARRSDSEVVNRDLNEPAKAGRKRVDLFPQARYQIFTNNVLTCVIMKSINRQLNISGKRKRLDFAFNFSRSSSNRRKAARRIHFLRGRYAFSAIRLDILFVSSAVSHLVPANSAACTPSTCGEGSPGSERSESSSHARRRHSGGPGDRRLHGDRKHNLPLESRSPRYCYQTSGVATGCSGVFSLSWAYDVWGNRTDQNVTAGTCNSFHATVGTNNRLASPYTYDAAGNMTFDGSHSYTYDAENRIISVDGGTTASYAYDPSGRRVSKKIGSTTTSYAYDQAGNVVFDTQGSTWAAVYLYFGGGLIAQYKNSVTSFIHRDHLGSTRFVTDMYQYVSDNLDYLPFGEQIAGDTTTTHKFTGYMRDEETEPSPANGTANDYASARYFGSRMGRFLTPDPAGTSATCLLNPQTQNRYAYVTDNPVNRTDPSGLFGSGGGGDDFPSPPSIDFPFPFFPTGGGSNPATPTPHPVFGLPDLLQTFSSRILSCAQKAKEDYEHCLDYSAKLRNQGFTVCTVFCVGVARIAGSAAAAECLKDCYASVAVTYGLDVTACSIEYGVHLAACKLHW